MWWTTVKWIVFGMALAMLGGNLCKAAPSPRDDDMYRELMKLDQLYSSIARPRFGKRGDRNEVPAAHNNISPEQYENNHIQYRTVEDEPDTDWLPLRR